MTYSNNEELQHCRELYEELYRKGYLSREELLVWLREAEELYGDKQDN